ncbi:MAG: dihydrolipoyllysine acetyltransferase [Desulfobacterales bacterium CG23_combo_of_CG06-09_8_20_14_all_52_9]|nr:MAG: dihydrolipoyllysine acetyltransferase [Desulfobacterales bacterium CG23_combo_of_CG06-09_8_20_14_all_52_9]
MTVEIRIPKLGLTMTDAVLVKWLIGAGDRVVKEQPVCVIETDKVTLELEASGEGLVHPIVEPGRRVAVGEVIGYLAADETELEALRAHHATAPTGPKETPAPKKPEKIRGATAMPKKSAGRGRILASPAARKLSTTLGVELKEIFGSGPGGRIILSDVQRFAETMRSTPFAGGYDIATVAPETELLTVAETIAIRGVRKIISRNMMLSLSRQAQLTLHTEASAVALRDMRALFNTSLEEGQPPVSYNAIIVKAAAQALRRYPMINAMVDGRDIRIWKQIHIGVAMDFGKGLIVPKIRNADTKSIQTISGELNDLAARAEKQHLVPDELWGGTFTITNLGNWDIDHFTPVNNFPESAILGMGRIVERPWVRDGIVVPEPRISLSLTFDHRIIDGALAAELLKFIKDRLEDTRLML